MDHNTPSPWREAIEDSTPPEAITQAAKFARRVWRGLLAQGHAALQWVANIQVPILDDQPVIEPIDLNLDDILEAAGSVDDDVDNSGIGIYNPYRNDLANWLE